MTTTITERVAAGAAWLDEQRPGWWQDGPDGIDLGGLDMDDACLCVLGQVFAEFDEDLFNSGFDYAANALDAPQFGGGFNISTWHEGRRRDSAEVTAEYTELGTAWKQLIAERRAAA